MKTPFMLAMSLGLSMLFLLAGCAEQSEVKTPSIYYSAPATSLVNEVGSRLTTLSKARPVSPQQREAIANSVKALNLDFPYKSKKHWETIRRIGDGAIVEIAELLNSQNDTEREKAIQALGLLKRVAPNRTKEYLEQTEPLIIALCRRSLVDRDVQVRMQALAILRGIGSQHVPNVPAGVLSGLDQALTDPDKRMNEYGVMYKKSLGLIPSEPEDGIE